MSFIRSGGTKVSSNGDGGGGADRTWQEYILDGFSGNQIVVPSGIYGTVSAAPAECVVSVSGIGTLIESPNHDYERTTNSNTIDLKYNLTNYTIKIRFLNQP